MPNYKELVESHVRGLFPELMELSRGCDFTDDDERYPHTIYEVRENHPFMFCALTDTHPDRFKDYDKTKCTIIGHPITLAHYLRALDRTFRILGNGEEYYKDKFVDENQILAWHESGVCVFFSLLTQEPSTPDDFRKMAEVLQIKID